MLLQTNSYVVPKEKRTEHARLLARFRQTLGRLGCDHFEVYEQTGVNWASAEGSGRFVQIMRFRDRNHQKAVQAAERDDPQAQALIREFCALIDFPVQQQAGKFVVGYYTSALPVSPLRSGLPPAPEVAAPVSTTPKSAPELSADPPPEVASQPPDDDVSAAMISRALDENVDTTAPGENGQPNSGLDYLADSARESADAESAEDAQKHRQQNSL